MSSFQGASQTFLTILTLFISATTICSLGLLIYCGVLIAWWVPFVVFFSGMIASCILAAVTVMIPDWILSLSGFIIVPTALLLMRNEIQNIAEALGV